MKLAAPIPPRIAASRKSFGPKTAVQRMVSLAQPARPPKAAPDGQALEDDVACLRRLRKIRNRFHLNSLVAQVLFVQLHEQAEAQYAAPHGSRHRFLQTGRAWRSFSNLFEPPSAIELVRLFENLLRFANDESYAPARGFFLAYAPLAFEHDQTGEFIGPGVWTPESGSRTAALRVRRTLKRWCDWLEALIHFQVHQLDHAGAPTLQLDKCIIFLWPLLKRHQWSCADLLMLLRSNAYCANCFPCQSEDQLAAYCSDSLRLHCPKRQPARPAPLAGRAVAERLLKFLPMMG